MKVLVCGGRTYDNFAKVWHVLYLLNPSTIIHGGAPGADTLANEYAKFRNVPCRVEYADWNKYGRSAGPKRNQKMLDEYFPELVVAFPGGKGTADMVMRAKKAGIPVKEI